MLIDAGPLVSLCDRKQPYHQQCRAALEAVSMPVLSTWAALAEAMHIVGRIGGYHLQSHLWTLMLRGIVKPHEHNDLELKQMAALMERYRNVPMDLADASLVVTGEATGDRTILTLDTDFRIYRFADGGAFTLVLNQS